MDVVFLSTVRFNLTYVALMHDGDPMLVASGDSKVKRVCGEGRAVNNHQNRFGRIG
jgi:hypothetical protein